MRLGILAHSRVLGGAEIYMARLAVGLVRRGHEVVLLGSIPGWSETGLDAVHLGLSGKWSASLTRKEMVADLVRVRAVRRSLGRLVDDLGVDCINSHFKREQVALTSAVADQVPVVWTEHGSMYNGKIYSPVLKAAYGRAARSTYGIVACSDAASEGLRTWAQGAKVFNIPNGVDTDFFRPPSHEERLEARERLALAHTEFVGAVVSRLDVAKRVDRVFAATRCRLVVAGDGDDRERLSSLDPEGRVTFLGHVDRDALRDVYWAADFVFCTASNAGEGNQLSLLEAAACGSALIGFSGDSIAGLVTRAGGKLVEEGLALAEVVPVPAKARQFALSNSESAWLDRYESLFCDAVV